MNVVPGIEGFYHISITAQVCHNAEFYLAVVGGEEQAPLIGNERLTHFLSVIVTHRDVLQVGIARTEASGSSHSLVV